MNDMLPPIATRLAKSELHRSLDEPVLDAMSFLNEVMDRFPAAISFAPGAPYAGFFDELDIPRYLARYTTYLSEERGLNPAQIHKRLYQYGPSKGEINSLLAASLRIDLGIDVAPAALVVTVGCQEALLLAVKALCASKTDLLAVVNPSFVGITGAACVLDVNAIPIDETEYGLDWDGLALACRQARTRGERVRALYVAPDFSNPSGSSLSLESRHRLLALAAQEDFLLLEDNAYGFTARDGKALPTLKALDADGRVIYLGTCAKTCLPGVRVGFIVADQLVVDRAGRETLLADHLAALKSMVTVNTSPICQAIIGGMLLEHGGSFAEVARRKSVFYQDNLALLLAALERHLGGSAALPGVSWNQPAGGFFVRISLPVAADLALLEKCAAEFGVLWTPMRHFHLDRGGDNALRLACSYLSAADIDEGIRRLAGFLRACCPGARSGMQHAPGSASILP